jgi:hypothetical protein
VTAKQIQLTHQQVKAVEAASVIVQGPAVEVSETIRRNTQKGNKTVVAGKRGYYTYVLVSGKPVDNLHYISSFAYKQATAQKVSQLRPADYSYRNAPPRQV